jgi:hypothetical protein
MFGGERLDVHLDSAHLLVYIHTCVQQRTELSHDRSAALPGTYD